MSIPLDRLAALCPPEIRGDLYLLSLRQIKNIKRTIKMALWYSRRCRKEHPLPNGRPITSTTPRAKYWREYKRRYHMKKAKKATP